MGNIIYQDSSFNDYSETTWIKFLDDKFKVVLRLPIRWPLQQQEEAKELIDDLEKGGIKQIERDDDMQSQKTSITGGFLSGQPKDRDSVASEKGAYSTGGKGYHSAKITIKGFTEGDREPLLSSRDRRSFQVETQLAAAAMPQPVNNNGLMSARNLHTRPMAAAGGVNYDMVEEEQKQITALNDSSFFAVKSLNQFDAEDYGEEEEGGRGDYQKVPAFVPAEVEPVLVSYGIELSPIENVINLETEYLDTPKVIVPPNLPFAPNGDDELLKESIQLVEAMEGI